MYEPGKHHAEWKAVTERHMLYESIDMKYLE